MSHFDTLITGGKIIDGAGNPGYIGCIGILDGKIREIGPDLKGTADQVIDATGKVVAAGIIDIHTHYDAQLHWDPYATNSGWHGTTTIAVGNCGFGLAPCRPEHRDRYMQQMETTEQVPYNSLKSALSWDWETYPEWLEHLKGIPKGVNVLSMVPLNPLMIYVMGLEAAKTRSATPEEREEMKAELNRAMDMGAIGFGFSYQGNHNTHIDSDGEPMPTDIMDVEDLYAMADVLRERGEGVIQALVDTPGARFSEVGLEVARRSGRPVIHNVTLVNDYLPTYHEEMLELLEKAKAEGLEMYSMTLTMRGWNEFKPMDWDIWNIIPAFREFTFAGDQAAKVAKAADEDFRARLREAYSPVLLAPAGGPLETYKLSNANGVKPWCEHEGKTVQEIAEALGRDCITDLFMDIVVDTEAVSDFLLPDAMSADTAKVAQVLKHPLTLPGTSDGGAHVKFWSGGHFSTDMIMWMVRESGQMTLEEMHFKLSGLPAKVFNLTDRSTLKKDSAADIVIYDYEALGYRRFQYDIAHDLPGGEWRRICKPEGIEYVLVNGEVTFRNGTECTGAVPGQLIGVMGAEMDGKLATPLAMAAE